VCSGFPRLSGSVLLPQIFASSLVLQILLSGVQRRRFVLACSHVHPCRCAWIFAVTWCPQSQVVLKKSAGSKKFVP
jgi:hypothetical protein